MKTKLLILSFALIASTSLRATNGVSTSQDVLPIAEALAADSAATVTVSGVVTFIRGSRYVYLQDSTGGVLLYTTSNACSVGEYVVATGRNAKYHGAPELDGAQILFSETGHEMPVEKVVSLTDLTAAPLGYFAQRVNVDGVYIASYDIHNGNAYRGLYVTDGVDTILCYYVCPEQSVFTIGKKVNLHLIAGYYDKFQFVGPSDGIELAPNNEELNDSTIGALPGVFSISPTERIHFSKGNLQYQASTDTWRFAEHQYGYIGDDNVNISPTYAGWIDLFGWGTGNNPTLVSTETADYATFTDWGTNAISNGGNQANLWRTLSDDEWKYIIYHRPHAHDLRSRATVCGVHGYILLPDNVPPIGWDWPFTDNYGWNSVWNLNTYDSISWTTLEAAGAVFLPAANGWYETENGTQMRYEDGSFGSYWSSSAGLYGGTTFTFAAGMRGDVSVGAENFGHSVRLAQNTTAHDSPVLRVVIQIPDSTECNGIALKGTFDGDTWSGANTYLGEDGAATPVEGNIYRFEPVKGYDNWYMVEIPATDGLEFQVCQIYVDDYSWEGQATNVVVDPYYSTIEPMNEGFTPLLLFDFINDGTGEDWLYLSIGGWQHSDCVLEPLLERTVTVTVPECGKETPSLVGTFNNWDPLTLPMTLVSGNTYTLTVEAKASDQFRFAGAVSGWDNEIWVYDDERYAFWQMPVLTFGEETNIVFDFSNPAFYRWQHCEDVPAFVESAFSVGPNRQVFFSQGNLQYQASTNTWRFAEHQYDTIGSLNQNISSTYDGWIDLFGWGTGNNPTQTSTNNEDYSSFTDWGTNAISNGDNQTSLWRTLSWNEWAYLLYHRNNADSLHGQASVDGVHGYVLLPDDWIAPEGLVFHGSPRNWEEISPSYEEFHPWRENQYTLAQWTIMESARAIFLPASGVRVSGTIVGLNSVGYYWCSSYNDDDNHCCADKCSFDELYSPQWDGTSRGYGFAVRLVKDVCMTSTSVEQQHEEVSAIRKVFEDGKLYILLPDGTRYDATGRKVE